MGHLHCFSSIGPYIISSNTQLLNQSLVSLWYTHAQTQLVPFPIALLKEESFHSISQLLINAPRLNHAHFRYEHCYLRTVLSHRTLGCTGPDRNLFEHRFFCVRGDYSDATLINTFCTSLCLFAKEIKYFRGVLNNSIQSVETCEMVE
jgi:hypothetical protein